MARLLARVARWSLPAALLVATLVAALGLGGLLFRAPAPQPPAPAVALNLGSAPALPAPDDGFTLTPQQLPALTPTPSCPDRPRACPPTPAATGDCCR